MGLSKISNSVFKIICQQMCLHLINLNRNKWATFDIFRARVTYLCVMLDLPALIKT